MNRTFALATIMVIMIGLIGVLLSAFGLNYIILCSVERLPIPGLLFAMISAIGLALVVRSARKRGSSDRKSQDLATACIFLFPVIGLTLQLSIPLVLLFSVDGRWIEATLFGLIAGFLMVIANFTIRAKQRAFGGIHNGWTMRSRSIWSKTHRIFGYSLIGGVLVAFSLTMTLSVAQGLLALILIYPICRCAAMVYALHLSVVHRYAS